MFKLVDHCRISFNLVSITSVFVIAFTVGKLSRNLIDVANNAIDTKLTGVVTIEPSKRKILVFSSDVILSIMNLMNKNTSMLNLINIAIGAGKIIMMHYKNSKKIIIKEDNSPLTKADLESNFYIIKQLNKLDSSIPILSEESLVNWSKRKEWNKYWLIDPLDGTKEFINENGEFTVNIALIENNKPILGVIYAPALFTLYYASKNFGSYKLNCSSHVDSLDTSKKIYVNEKNQSEEKLIIGSRSHSNENFNQWIKENVKNYKKC